MKHTFDELYHVRNFVGIFSEKAVEGLTRRTSWRDTLGQDWECEKVIYPSDKEFHIRDSLTSKEYRIGYSYGSKFWFDTKEELEEYRANIKEGWRINRIKKAKQGLYENIKTLMVDGEYTKEEIEKIFKNFLENA